MEKELRLHIGRRVRELRRKAKMTTTSLAERSGLSRQTISNLENGRLETREVTIRDVAKALGTTLAELSKPEGGNRPMEEPEKVEKLARLLARQDAAPYNSAYETDRYWDEQVSFRGKAEYRDRATEIIKFLEEIG